MSKNKIVNNLCRGESKFSISKPKNIIAPMKVTASIPTKNKYMYCSASL